MLFHDGDEYGAYVVMGACFHSRLGLQMWEGCGGVFEVL